MKNKTIANTLRLTSVFLLALLFSGCFYNYSSTSGDDEQILTCSDFNTATQEEQGALLLAYPELGECVSSEVTTQGIIVDG